SRVFIAASAADGAIRVWRIDTTDEDYQMMCEGHSATVTNICFSNDGKLLASKAQDGTVRLWRTPDWQCVAVIDVTASGAGQPPNYAAVLAFHPQEPWLATCVEDSKTISILEL